MMLKNLLAIAALAALSAAQAPAPAPPPLPSEPLRFGGFSARFGPDGSFALEGAG